MAAVIWLIAGIALIGAEVLTGTFVLLMLGGGALAAAVVAAVLAPPLAVDAVVFAVVSALLLLGVRPALRGREQPELEAADNSPVGSAAVVVLRVDGHGGQVKIDGELWSARALDRARVFEPGERVTVMQLSGVTAMVSADL